MLFAFFWTGFSQAFLQHIQEAGRIEYGMCFCHPYFPLAFFLIHCYGFLLQLMQPAVAQTGEARFNESVKRALGMKQAKIPHSEGLHFL